jgi:hypothetical protein
VLRHLETKKRIMLSGVAWKCLKQILWKVLPVLTCWKILVLLKSVDGFESTMAKVEVIAVRPEELPVTWRSDADPDTVTPDVVREPP